MVERDTTHGLVPADGLVRMVQDGRITRRGFLARVAGLLGSAATADGLLARAGRRAEQSGGEGR